MLPAEVHGVGNEAVSQGDSTAEPRLAEGDFPARARFLSSYWLCHVDRLGSSKGVVADGGDP